MKSYHIISSALCLMAASSAFAQDYTDALRFNSNDLIGTARSQAMGGAFGAVGADLTSMAINPAGMGVYRATEMGLTLGVNAIKDDASFFSTNSSSDRVKVSFNQLGVGFCIGRMRENGGGAVAHNIFVGYNRLADFNNEQTYEDYYSKNSLLDYFCFNEQKTGALTGGLAYDAYLTNDTAIAGQSSKFTYNVWEDFVVDGVNPYFRIDENGDGLIEIKKRVKENGSKGDIPVGYAVNIANKFYVGGSLHLRTLTYERNITHTENFCGYTVYSGDPTSFSYFNYLKQDGTGVGFHLGVIYRPVNALRIGFALHSPTFYTVNERYWAEIDNPTLKNTVRSDTYEYEYKYREPSRFIASVAGVFGKVGMLSFDYERTNNSRSKFKVSDDDEYDNWSSGSSDAYDGVNKQMKDYILQASNTFRVGGELSLLKPLYIRAGYRLTTTGVKKPYYVNEAENYSFSGGLGYRHNNFFIDLTYVCNTKKTDHWVLPDSAEEYTYEANTPAWLVQKTHSGVITVGFRF